MACCAFAIYLLGRFLAGLDWVGARVPFLPQGWRDPGPSLAANWRPGRTDLTTSPASALPRQATRRLVFGRVGALLAVAAGLELLLVLGATLGWSLVSLVPEAPPALLGMADTALSICRSLQALGPSF